MLQIKNLLSLIIKNILLNKGFRNIIETKNLFSAKTTYCSIYYLFAYTKHKTK